MQVSGISGGGVPSLGVGGASAAGSGTSAGAQISLGAGQSATITGGTSGINSLVQSMQDFSSAEILMALMLLAASRGDDDDKHKGGGGGAALGMLAGMALAGGLGQSMNDLSISLNNASGSIDIAGVGGGMGMSLNLQG